MFKRIWKIFKKKKKRQRADKVKTEFRKRVEELLKSGLGLRDVLMILSFEQMNYTSLLTVSLVTVLLKKKVVKEKDLDEEIRKIIEGAEEDAEWLKDLIEKLRKEEELSYFG